MPNTWLREQTLGEQKRELDLRWHLATTDCQQCANTLLDMYAPSDAESLQFITDYTEATKHETRPEKASD